MKPAANIIVRAPSQLPVKLILLALAGGIALVLWSRMGSEQKAAPADATACVSSVTPIQVTPEPKRAFDSRLTEIGTDVLRADGITIADWISKIASAGPGSIHFSPESLLTSLPALRICEYEGDTLLPIEEALDLLRFAGLSVHPMVGSNRFEIKWADSRTLVSNEVFSTSDPESLAWGSLRSWQHVTMKSDSPWRSTLGDAKKTKALAAIRTMGWAVQGETLDIEIGADGRIVATRSRVPVEAEMDLALDVFTANAEVSDVGFDAMIGVGAIAKADLLSKDSVRSGRAIKLLVRNLSASPLEIRCGAAWSLGRVTDVSALEALVSTVENADCPDLLASATLVALINSEKLNRRLSAVELGQENWVRRQVAYERVRKWLATPCPRANMDLPSLEYSTAFVALAEAFQIDKSLPHISNFQALCSANPMTKSKAFLSIAGPNWLHGQFESGDAIQMLRLADRRSVRAALWRWNRPGADTPSMSAFDGEEALLDLMKSNLKNSPSATQRRMALEALFRPSDARLGGERRSLCQEPSLALNAFLNDPSRAVQRTASDILGRVAGIVQLQSLSQATFDAQPPAGTDQLLKALVQRFWTNAADAEEFTVSLNQLIDHLLTSEVASVAQCAAWAKMQNPNIGASDLLRVAKAMVRPELRAAALSGIPVSRTPAEIPPKFVSVFLMDETAMVREAAFKAHLPQWVKRGPEQTKLYALGLQDPEVSVRLAVLNAWKSVAADSREALRERVNMLAESDASELVRAAAKNWKSSDINRK